MLVYFLLRTAWDELRSTNIALQKQLDEQRKRYEGIDPDEVRKLTEEKRKYALSHSG